MPIMCNDALRSVPSAPTSTHTRVRLSTTNVQLPTNSDCTRPTNSRVRLNYQLPTTNSNQPTPTNYQPITNVQLPTLTNSTPLCPLSVGVPRYALRLRSVIILFLSCPYFFILSALYAQKGI
ncbi:hypothetical protein AB1N83_013377 [Pleurotus pulmonarius]